jgi:hypothetical protein
VLAAVNTLAVAGRALLQAPALAALKTSTMATGAAIAAGLALLLVLVTLFLVWRLRATQSVILGDGKSDLIDFAVSLQGRIDDVHKAIDEIASALTRVDKRIDGTVSNVAVVRYDAYEDKGGQQSATVAILDGSRTGIVLTAMQGRDYARIYMKEIDRGNCAIMLSPEEEEAVRRAMAR